LLGLGLLFCLRGEHAGYHYSIFLENFVDLFWFVLAAADDKHGNVGGNFTKPTADK